MLESKFYNHIHIKGVLDRLFQVTILREMVFLSNKT